MYGVAVGAISIYRQILFFVDNRQGGLFAVFVLTLLTCRKETVERLGFMEKGSELEEIAKKYFSDVRKVNLEKFSLDVGTMDEFKKRHKFDLGNEEILVECKSYKWRKEGGVPSAKITTLNEAMLYFTLVPVGYEKILFALKDYNPSKQKTLVLYYIEKNYHLIPQDVSVYEYNIDNGSCEIYDFERRKEIIKRSKK
jgi:hypothetical protein